jgi:MinD-like ATPase involved in chromosome partitioning or flagellar assembly
VFCTTFYSFKGGVGRTLALANAALVLGRQGKRVLLVDFDLEAPGLTTLAPFASAAGRPGIVDYVHEYIATDEAPDAARFIHTCHVTESDWEHDEEYAIDVMPAGRDDEGYAERFATIDWNELYDHHDGFYLLENLRESWERAGYDYVLIDSRTGHTDIGGICTRQLPDLVVAIFFPNEQNLQGLAQVVRGVRGSNARARPIDLMFVASRVPRLDDEHSLLQNQLRRFQDSLEYSDDQLVMIEHYDSMMLLNQTLFVADRPTSGLARQYNDLVSRLVQFNLEDARGALSVIQTLTDKRSLRVSPWRTMPDEDIWARLRSIAKKHDDDCIIQHALARGFYRLRMLQDSALALDNALASFGRTQTGRDVDDSLMLSIHHLRLRLFTELQAEDEVVRSARAILADPTAPNPMILDALRAFPNVDTAAAEILTNSPALTRASQTKLWTIAQQLADSPSGARLGAELTDQLLRTNPRLEANETLDDTWAVQITLIVGGNFAEAVAVGERLTGDEPDLPGAFNTAVARWGRDRTPNLEEFRRVLEIFARYSPLSDPNTLQCHALAHAVVGNVDHAITSIEAARKSIRERHREFSCWTYFTVSAQEFNEHLDCIGAFARGNGAPPEVLVRGWDLAAAAGEKEHPLNAA